MHKAITLIILLFTTIGFSQKSSDKTVYLDSLGLETTFDNHHTYRVIKDFTKKRKSYIIYEYYKSGKLKSEGVCLDNITLGKDGIFNYYYESGKLKSRIIYKDKKPFGEYLAWYENESKKTIGEYAIKEQENDEPVLLILNHWNEKGDQTVVDGNGFYTETNDFYSNSGLIKNGLKDSIWNGTSIHYKLTFEEKYKKGKLVNGISTDHKGIKYNYKAINQFADPKKGMAEFRKKFANTIVPFLPEVHSNISEIKLLASFRIEENGKFSNVKILKGYNKEFDIAFFRILSNQEAWHPAKYRGKTIPSQFTLPITMKIF